VAKAWEQREKESPQAFAAFEAYRAMEPEDRSLAKVGKALGKSAPLMERWSATHGWLDRARAWDNELARKVLDEEQRRQAKAIAKVRGRYRDAGELAMKLVLARLKEVEAKGMLQSSTDLYRIAKTALALEATGLGIGNQTQAQQSNEKVATSGDADAVETAKNAAKDGDQAVLIRKLEIEVIGAGGQIVPASELSAANLAKFFDKPQGGA
jgi:hypothetical protein